MTDFNIHIDKRAFGQRGTRVNFDKDRYDRLLDDLVEVVPVAADTIRPVVNIKPAPIWGASRLAKYRAYVAHQSDFFEEGDYNVGTKTINLAVEEDQASANRLLLYYTRCWSGDMDGTYHDHRQKMEQHILGRSLLKAATIGVGAFSGYEFAQSGGAAAGGVIAFMVSFGGDAMGEHNSPYRQSIRSFIQDPDVQANYGSIISYESI